MQNRTRQIDTWYSLLVYISIAYDEWFHHNFAMFRSQNLHHKNTHQSNANSENSISYQNFVFAYFYVLLHIFVRCTVEFYIFFFIFRLLANDTLRWFVVISLLTVLVHLNSFVCAVIFTIFLLGQDLFFWGYDEDLWKRISLVLLWLAVVIIWICVDTYNIIFYALSF